MVHVQQNDTTFSLLATLVPARPQDGVVVVCVNWLNRERVYEAAERCGGQVKECWGFKGRRGKPVLFGVWVIGKGKEGGEEKEVRTEEMGRLLLDEVFSTYLPHSHPDIQ